MSQVLDASAERVSHGVIIMEEKVSKVPKKYEKDQNLRMLSFYQVSTQDLVK